MKKRLFLVSIMTMLLCCCGNGKKSTPKESEKVSYCLDNLVSAYDFTIYEKDTKSYICILEYKNESRLNVVNFECGRNYAI